MRHRLARRPFYGAGLLGRGMLGQGAGSVAAPDRHIGPPYYLLNDTFTTDRSAGAVNGTDAEPGPGRRTVTDGNSKLSIAGGAVSLATGGVGAGNPGLYYGELARVVGLLYVASITPNTATFQLGWETNTAASIAHGWRLGGASTMMAFVNGSPLVVGAWAADAQSFACAARASGFFYLQKANGGQWLLHWISTAGSQGPLRPALVAESKAAVVTADYIRVPALKWLPAPLLSDGFSVINASDGRGHAEGVAASVGLGGLGRYYSVVGTWGVSGGALSASALSGGYAIRYAALGADVVATVKVTRGGGDAGLLLRFTDSNNHITCHLNGTNVILLKKVAGSSTTVQSTAATYSAGAELRVVATGTKFRVYYNNVLIGSEQTISDSALQSATNVGVYSTNTGNSFDDLTVYPRGSNGEYDILDEATPALPTDYLFVVGDSKATDEYNGSANWIVKLMGELGARRGKRYQEITPRAATVGHTVAACRAYIDANLPAIPDTPAPSIICVNIGINDVAGPTTPPEAPWKANLTSILDSLTTKWPAADIFVAKPWRVATDSESAAVAGYIDDVIATYADHVFVGHDESVWAKGSDNGASMMPDSVHYNTTTAQTVAAAEWLKAIEA